MKPKIHLILILFFFSACDITEQDEFQELIVVESVATANRPLPIVSVTKTLPSDQKFTFDEAGINTAIVQVVRLDDNGTEEIFEYEVSSSFDGIYRPLDRSHLVQPLGRYRLDVQFNDRPERVQAETVIPDQFEIINSVQDSIVFQSAEQLEIILSESQRVFNQNVFVFSTIADVVDRDQLTPFYLDIVENGDSELRDLSINSSGLVNEGNFTLNEDGTITLKFPWIGVAFFGANKIVVSTVDRNLFDLVRSQDVQLGGSTLPPGEIPNLIYNVDGGIGVFGSVASDTVETFIIKPDNLND